MIEQQAYNNAAEVNLRYEKLQVDNWLCPKMNSSVILGGKASSEQYMVLSVEVNRCKNASVGVGLCGSAQQLDDYFTQNQQSFLTFFTVNAVINPDQKDYISYFLEDRNWVIFSKQQALELDIYYSDVTIETDTSILPFKNVVTQQINILNFNPVLYPYKSGLNLPFARFYVGKDQTSITYRRQVQKVSAVLSFIGGIIGAILAILFILNTYTSFSLQLTVAYKVFRKYKKDDDNQGPDEQESPDTQNQSRVVNVVEFVKYYVFRLVRWVQGKKVQKEWASLQYMHECREEILEQLDIRRLIERIIFLQYSMNFLFQDYQLQIMKMDRPNHPLEVQRIRNKMSNPSNKSQSPQTSDNPNVSDPVSQHSAVNLKDSNLLHKIEIRQQDISQPANTQSQNMAEQMVNEKEQQNYNHVVVQKKKQIKAAYNLRKYPNFMLENDEISQIDEIDFTTEKREDQTKHFEKLIYSVNKGNMISRKIAKNLLNDNINHNLNASSIGKIKTMKNCKDFPDTTQL